PPVPVVPPAPAVPVVAPPAPPFCVEPPDPVGLLPPDPSGVPATLLHPQIATVDRISSVRRGIRTSVDLVAKGSLRPWERSELFLDISGHPLARAARQKFPGRWERCFDRPRMATGGARSEWGAGTGAAEPPPWPRLAAWLRLAGRLQF